MPGRTTASETEPAAFFDLSIDLLCIVGLDGRFKRVNRSLARTLGYPASALVAKPIRDIAHPDDAERLSRLAEGPELAGVEARAIAADGSIRWLEWTTRILPERGLVYAVARDTTELRETRRLLEASRDEQAALRRVAALVAHAASPSAVFDAVTAEAANVLEASAVSLARYGDDVLTVVATSGATYVRVGDRFALGGRNVTSIVQRTGRSARLDDLADATGTIGGVAQRAGVRSTVAVPVVVDGRTWGVLAALWADRAPAPDDTEERMSGFAELLGTAIANAVSREQLMSSRARVLAAGDDARRRVVRDLHDGAQQRLLHTIVTLKLAQERRGDADALIAEALENAERATAELRELAHGILPTALTRGGLEAGVAAFVSRLRLPVDVDVLPRRVPPDLEASAYFIVAEALTNVVKHAHATRAQVRVTAAGGALAIEVRDDGVGGADPQGHGLMGIADRVDALGGRLRIATRAGGTVLAAELPLPSEAAYAAESGTRTSRRVP